MALYERSLKDPDGWEKLQNEKRARAAGLFKQACDMGNTEV
jgi:hypothetical protein